MLDGVAVAPDENTAARSRVTLSSRDWKTMTATRVFDLSLKLSTVIPAANTSPIPTSPQLPQPTARAPDVSLSSEGALLRLALAELEDEPGPTGGFIRYVLPLKRNSVSWPGCKTSTLEPPEPARAAVNQPLSI